MKTYTLEYTQTTTERIRIDVEAPDEAEAIRIVEDHEVDNYDGKVVEYSASPRDDIKVVQ